MLSVCRWRWPPRGRPRPLCLRAGAAREARTAFPGHQPASSRAVKIARKADVCAARGILVGRGESHPCRNRQQNLRNIPFRNTPVTPLPRWQRGSSPSPLPAAPGRQRRRRSSRPRVVANPLPATRTLMAFCISVTGKPQLCVDKQRCVNSHILRSRQLFRRLLFFVRLPQFSQEL